MKEGFGFRALALCLAFAMTLSSLPVGVVHASMVMTDRVVEQSIAAEQQQARAEVMSFLAREDVRAELAAQGVDPDEAAMRVAALSDEEIAVVHGKIAELPAGESIGAVVGAILFVFIVLLITDLAGLTNVFSFTRR